MRIATSKQMHLLAGAVTAAGVILAANAAHAAEASATADVGAGVSTDSSGSSKADNSSAFLLAGKVGGIIPFSKMKPFVSGGLELGWIFGGTHRSIGALLDVSYTVPRADGSETDPLGRLPPSNKYNWHMTQKELVLQPTFLYRLTSLSKTIVPYAGIGPRIYFLQTVVKGSSNNQQILETKEQSTKFGVGLPLGAEYELGPGGVFLEALFQWGPLNHTITGSSNTGGATIWLGYRALL